MLGRGHSFFPGVTGSCSKWLPGESWGQEDSSSTYPFSGGPMRAITTRCSLWRKQSQRRCFLAFPRSEELVGRWAKGQMAKSPAKTTNLSSRLPSGTSGTPLTSWTLEEKRGVVRNPQYTPLDLKIQVSLPTALTVGPRSPRGPDFPDRPCWQ